ncbi:hypothetical protein PspLS_04386 [Pyricularia sp. CBS 133598]|nr:hypothetical protein PspLS_04386 [Pyricularia sp. CBS 133598]
MHLEKLTETSKTKSRRHQLENSILRKIYPCICFTGRVSQAGAFTWHFPSGNGRILSDGRGTGWIKQKRRKIKNKKNIGRHCLPGSSGATAPVVPVWHDGHLIAELVAFGVDGPAVAGVRACGACCPALLCSASGGIERRMGY